MKAMILMTDEQLVSQAVSLLLDKLGPVETNRFLAMAPKKRLESVARHQEWQSKLDKETFFNRIMSKANNGKFE